MNKSSLKHIANLWSLTGCPSPKKEWSLGRKLRAVKQAGFDGFCSDLSPEHAELAGKLGLMTLGFFSSATPSEFRKLLRKQKNNGARYINVQLGDHDTPTGKAVEMAVRLMEEAGKLGVEPSVEVHRDTCTETPEKTYALADGFQKATGALLPMTWDCSHLAVVKHLAPPFHDRLLVRPDLIQRAEQFHLRPFNGHHCQVPVTNGKGKLTPEVKDWFPFVGKLFEMILAGNPGDKDIFAVPEMGPYGGYNLSSLPSSWEDAVVLRGEIARIWKKAVTTAFATEE